MNDLLSLDAVQQESDPDKPASRAHPPIPLPWQPAMYASAAPAMTGRLGVHRHLQSLRFGFWVADVGPITPTFQVVAKRY